MRSEQVEFPKKVELPIKVKLLPMLSLVATDGRRFQ